MADTIPITFTNTNPRFNLKAVAPEELPISMAEAIQGVSGTNSTIANPEDIEGFATDPTFYYILAST